jgi:hypothetical protein
MSGLIIPGNMKLGGAVVTLGLHQKDLDSGLKTAKGKILRFTQWVWNHRRAVTMGTLAAASGGVAAALAANQMMNVWTQTELAMNRIKILTEEMSGSAINFATDLGSRMRITKREALDLYSRFFAMGRGLEMSKEEATKFAQKLSVLTHDFAALHGMVSEEAADRMVSAMSGSAEVMDQFGVNLRQAQIELELASMGIKENAQNADELSKAYARLNIIEKTLKRQNAASAVGTYLKSWLGITRRIATAWERLKVAIGNAFGPFVNRIAESFASVFESTVALFERIADNSVVMFALDHLTRWAETFLYLLNQQLKIVNSLAKALNFAANLSSFTLGGGRDGGLFDMAFEFGRAIGQGIKNGFDSIEEWSRRSPSPAEYDKLGGLLGTYSAFTGQEAFRAGPQTKADKLLQENQKQTTHLMNIDSQTKNLKAAEFEQ